MAILPDRGIQPRTAVSRRGFLAISAGALSAGCSRKPPTVTTSGATTVQHIYALVGDLFTDETGIRLDAQGGGSTRGIVDVNAGRVQIGGVAREPTTAERERANFRPLARDGIAVIVHPSSPLSALTSTELRGIYTSTTNAPAWTRVVMADGHGTRDSFLAHLDVRPSELAADISANSVTELILTVARLPQAIGFVSSAEAQASISRDRMVRVVPLDDALPTPEMITAGRYPMIRTLYSCFRGSASREALRFLDYLEAPRARAVMADLEFLPPIPER